MKRENNLLKVNSTVEEPGFSHRSADPKGHDLSDFTLSFEAKEGLVPMGKI